MIVIVSGTRDAGTPKTEEAHRLQIGRGLRFATRQTDGHILYSGAATGRKQPDGEVSIGVDKLCEDFAEEVGWQVRRIPADWEAPCRDACKPGHRVARNGGDYCPAAGIYRNTQIVDEVTAIDTLRVGVTFPGPESRGTVDMIDQLWRAHITTLIVPLWIGDQ